MVSQHDSMTGPFLGSQLNPRYPAGDRMLSSEGASRRQTR